jgi:thymidylate synthase
MPDPYIAGDTLDDLMRFVIERIQSDGVRIEPTKGAATELTGVMLELADPRARLSRTETRGKPFSCLGELCWYLAASNDIEFIAYYVPEYREYADGDVVFGGYGPRLFNWRRFFSWRGLFSGSGLNQLERVTAILKERPDSRQAVVQLFDAGDLALKHKDVPCTCTLQFLIRHNALQLVVNMRSNDAFLGLPHDVFCFTMLQEIIATTLSVDLGKYKHAVGSLHLYDKNEAAAQQFLGEGWQSTVAMPPMPQGDPWPAIDTLRKAEAAIRTKRGLALVSVQGLEPYWADLVRLLQIFRCVKDKNAAGIQALRGDMSSDVYRLFIDQRLSQL